MWTPPHCHRPFQRLVLVVGKKAAWGDTHIPRLTSRLVFWLLAATWGRASAGPQTSCRVAVPCLLWVPEPCSPGAHGYVHPTQTEESKVSGLGALIRGQVWRPGWRRVYRESAQTGRSTPSAAGPWSKVKVGMSHAPSSTCYSRPTAGLHPPTTKAHFTPPALVAAHDALLPYFLSQPHANPRGFWVYTFSQLLNQTLI